MRKYLIFFLFAVANNLQAQSYQSIFGSTQTSWNIKHEQLFGDYTDSLTVIGDTLINSITYKTLNYFSYFSSTPSLMTVKGFLREDTLTGKAWYKSSVDTVERLLMNLSLSIGDTFQLFNIGGGLYFPVDSVYFLLGKKYVRLNYLFNNEKVLMIEGTGTNLGIRYTEYQYPGVNPYLLCQHKDFFPEYVNQNGPWANTCNVITGIGETESSNQLKVFPNPVQSDLIIDFEKNSNSGITIYDLRGIALKKTTHNFTEGNRLFHLSVNELLNGVYFLKIQTENSVHITNFIKD